jgi:hypothetical protein
MKAKNEKSVKRAPRYFLGSTIQDLMFDFTQAFVDIGIKNDSTKEKITIIPVHPKPYKLWWEFYAGDFKICTICYEAQDERTGLNNECWLEWYGDSKGIFLEELYYSCIGLPDWVETEEDEEEFFRAA